MNPSRDNWEKEKRKGYLDAKDGDVGVGHTGNAVLKPQAIGFLYIIVSLAKAVWCAELCAYPGDVVVRVHDTEHSVHDEDEHKHQPVREVIQAVSLDVGRDECAESDECRRLRCG